MPSDISFGVYLRKASISFQNSRVGGGGGGGWVEGTPTPPFIPYSVKLCAMFNFSLHHNVLCLSFVVVLYSMYSLYMACTQYIC